VLRTTDDGFITPSLFSSMRPVVTCAGLIALWWLVQSGLDIPPYLLPSPIAVADALWSQRVVLAAGAVTTLVETLLGLALGSALGAAAALLMSLSPITRRWLMPVLLLSQAVPVFALAPLLVLWLGFGIASKVAMAALVIFFPVMSAFHDGLRRVPPGWLDLAHSMDAPSWRVLLLVRVPAALPGLGSGLRVAAAWAPIGAVIGEWVGASSGLGTIMLNANARVRTDVMFAALAVLSAMTIAIWWSMDRAVHRLLSWEAPGDTG
jgi:putative hydroxymethylpyrimidine transport system permease protein